VFLSFVIIFVMLPPQFLGRHVVFYGKKIRTSSFAV